MKHILHVSGVKGSAMSGAETVLLNLINCLGEQGYESVVVVSGPGRFTSLLASKGVSWVYVNMTALFPERFTLAFASSFLVHLFRTARRLAKEVRKRQIQLIVTHTRGGHLYGWLAGWLAGVPVVMYCHDLSHSKMSRLIKTFLVLNASKVIAISRAVKEDLIAFPVFRGWVGQKIIVIPNAVNLQQFHPGLDGGNVKSEFGLESAFPIVGLIGQLVAWKGQLDFIKAASAVVNAFPTAKFLIVGDAIFGNADYEKQIRHSITTLGLDDYVILTGHRTNVPELMAALDILVSASWAEPFGLVIIEAMATGKPVIGTHAGGIPEIVLEGETGLLVPPHSAHALADAIIRLASDRDALKLMGEAGRRRAEECYSIARWRQTILPLFAGILN